MLRQWAAITAIGLAHLLGVSDTIANDALAYSFNPSNADSLFSVENGKTEAAEADGGKIIRWHITAGQTSRLAIRSDNPIFQRLRYYDRFDFEFRITGGEISSLDMQALGHVSGPYQCKVHEWHLSVHTSTEPEWKRRQIDLTRPAWYPWDNPDGEGGDFFRLSCLALMPDTVVELRNLRLSRAILNLKPDFEQPITWPVLTRNKDGSILYTARYMIRNSAGRPVEVESSVASKHRRFAVTLRNADVSDGEEEGAKVRLKNGKVATYELTAAMTADDVKATEELYSEPLKVTFAIAGEPESACVWQGFLVRPLSPELKRQVIIPQQNLELIRKRLSAGDADIRKLLVLDNVLKAADELVTKKFLHIPTDHMNCMNKWIGDWRPEDSMPEIVNTKTGEREFGTDRAGYTWKVYFGYPGFALENLGKAYLYTGDEKYAEKAVELFGLYASQYPELLWMPRSAQTLPWDRSPVVLCESRVAMSSSYGSNMFFKWHCKLLSMTADSPAWTEEKRRDVYMGFVLPYATELMKFPGGINNMTDVTNHNLLLMGIVFDDATMVRHATMTDSGIISRLGDIDEDGFSSEGRPLNYHYAGMTEYLPALSYLANSGLALKYPKDNLLAAFRMPFKRAALNGLVPNSGDCGLGQRVGPKGLADDFISIFPDEDWLYDAGASPFTASLAGKKLGSDGWMKLLSTEPVLFRHAGLAVLRSGSTVDTQVMATLDYGRNVMHAALDRNHITLTAFGKIFAHGTGSLYNLGSSGIKSDDPRLNAFISVHSIAQNLVVVDQKDQLPAVGRLLAYSPGPDLQVVASRVDGIAPGVGHVRALALVKGVAVVLDRLESEQDHVYDFAYHNFGELGLGDGWNSTPSATPLGTAANYDNIIDLKKLQGSGNIRLEWDLTGQTAPQKGKDASSEEKLPPVKLSLWQNNSAAGELYTGITGLNNPNTGFTPDKVPSLFHRIRGKTAEFATVLEPHKGKTLIQSVQFPSQSSVKIAWADGSQTEMALDALLKEYSCERKEE